MPTSIISPDQDSITAEVDIAAPPERVFRALTDPAEVKQWGNSPQFEVKIWEMDMCVGGRWRFLCKENTGKPNKYGVDEFDHHGEILEIDPPRLLVYTWITNFHEDISRKTVVRWELTPTATGTHLKVTHSGLAQEPKARQDYAGGWPGFIAAVKNHVEKQTSSDSAASSTVDNDAIVSEIHIAALPERVFQALIDPQQVLQWWGQEGVYRCTGFAGDVRPGGKWHSSGLGPDGAFDIRGEYLEVDPPRLLAYTWVASWTGAVQTTVRWELEPAHGGTLLRIRHCGLAAHPELAQSYRGWPRMLGWLRAYVETGETVQSRKLS